MEEIWKDDVEDPRYKVSSLGVVKKINGKPFKPKIDHYGYIIVSIGPGKKVHRLVAKAFIPNPNNYPQVNHINGIKTDNRVENLEWCNNSHNIRHADRLGLRKMPVGSDHPNTNLSDEDVRLIKFLLKKNLKPKQLAGEFSVSLHTIYGIREKRTWTHI